MDDTTIAFWALAVSAAALLISIVAGLVSARREQRAHDLGLLTALEEIRDPTFRRSLDYILEHFTTDYSDAQGGLEQVAADHRTDLRRVMSYYNSMGVLHAKQVVPAELISALMGGSVVRTWRLLVPYIRAERILRAKKNPELGASDDMYYAYYESLATTLASLGPAALSERATLARWNE